VEKESITKRPLPDFVKAALRPYQVPSAGSGRPRE
jgi:hypothetical protein